MRISEKVLKEIDLDKYQTSEMHVNTPPTYQEDRAFMRRMDKINFDRMTKPELRKIYRIALSGLDVRSKVDLELAHITRSKAERMASGTLDNGLKHSAVFEQIAEMLRGFRG